MRSIDSQNEARKLSLLHVRSQIYNCFFNIGISVSLCVHRTTGFVPQITVYQINSAQLSLPTYLFLTMPTGTTSADKEIR
jgi:hypothetical protein